MPHLPHHARSQLQVSLLTKTFLTLGTSVADPSDLYFGFHLRMRGPSPGLTALREKVDHRAHGQPLLTHRLAFQEGHAWWEPDPDFDVTHHVQALTAPGLAPGPAQALLTAPPDASHPRWGLWLHRTDTEDWAITFLAHHAVMDATAMLHTLQALLGPDADDMEALPRHRPARASRRAASLLPLLPDLLATYLPHVTSPPPPARWHQRELAHASVDLELLRTTARANGSTLNQVHLAALAGALRTWGTPNGYAHRPWWQRGPYVLVPVDTRATRQGATAITPRSGNQLGLLRVPLPCGHPDGTDRLTAITTTAGRRHTARRRSALRTLTEHTPERLASWLLRRLTDPGDVVLTASHVRAPGLMTVLGAPVIELTAIPWLPPGHSCFTFLTTHNQTARLSALTSAPAQNPQQLVQQWSNACHETASSHHSGR
ncbi:wax ester/triacylglycerol synthase domain-containing protein [Streptomyces sp. NPDC051554]|uniref:wax ester/triacylglycerol synthase domain-containing protein n=1 Tax=Streptomyces sp. NPDC051554 TaxID=3365656 RepID=UPI0037923902